MGIVTTILEVRRISSKRLMKLLLIFVFFPELIGARQGY